MADVSDVVATLTAEATTLLLPGGVPVAGNQITIMQGWPLDTDLDAMVSAYNGGAPPSALNPLVNVYPRPGMYRNTSRYPTVWQEQSRPAKTLTGTVADNQATIGGTPAASLNVALIVGFGSGHQAFVYPTTGGDTLNSIASGLAALVNAATPASAAGPVITIPAAFSIVLRVGVIGTAIRELRRQVERFDVHIWTPTPSLRDALGAALRVGIGQLDYLTLPDLFAARIKACDDHWVDDPEKAGLFRRMMGFDIEYATTQTMPSAEIIVFESQQQGGQSALGTAPQVNVFA